jgi:hypothetical protein
MHTGLCNVTKHISVTTKKPDARPPSSVLLIQQVITSKTTTHQNSENVYKQNHKTEASIPAVEYQPMKETRAVAVALQDQLVHLKMANWAKTCCTYLQ